MLIIQRPTVEPIGEPDQFHQRFAIGPLDPGFGHSLGASLRRTLLSSIPARPSPRCALTTPCTSSRSSQG